MRKLKLYGILIAAAVVVLAAAFGYLKIKDVQSTLKEAEANNIKAQKFESISQSMQEERSRCQAFVSQEQGEFGEFEYCKIFLDWSNNLDIETPR